MHTAWLAIEHNRIHLIEQWPSGPRKDASLASARSALESLQRSLPPESAAFRCAICATRRNNLTLVDAPVRPQVSRGEMAA
jgi:hypothetical protein